MSKKTATIVAVFLLLSGSVDAQRYAPEAHINTLFGPARELFRSTVVQRSDTRSPVLAGALSAILPGIGLGSFYAGSPSHGLRHLLITLGLAVSIGVGCDLKENGCDGGDAVGTVGGVLILANAVWSIFAAVGDANRFNERATAPPRAP